MTDGATQATIARRVRALRKARGLSQTELGVRAGISQSYVGKLEQDGGCNMTLETLEAVARALGVTVLELQLPMEPIGQAAA
ncbi:MAG: helix-turn-helix domain-containing protein [Thiohalocapsa sp.]|nr:helix-turn-helix domain-containing protein [Thiohalocapsa sp.]